jgi:hypothetical protein
MENFNSHRTLFGFPSISIGFNLTLDPLQRISTTLNRLRTSLNNLLLYLSDLHYKYPKLCHRYIRKNIKNLFILVNSY